MSLVRNEQTKLTATWLNGVAIGAVAIGGIAPFAAVILGTSNFVSTVLSAMFWIAFGLALHWGARQVLRRLIE